MVIMMMDRDEVNDGGAHADGGDGDGNNNGNDGGNVGSGDKGKIDSENGDTEDSNGKQW